MAFRLSTGLRVATIGAIGFAQGLKLGRIDIFNGTIPSSPDDSSGGATLLLSITVDGNPLPGGGLELEEVGDGSVRKPAAAVWKGTAVADGIASWFRYYDPNTDDSSGTTAVRFDGTVGTTAADLIMTNVNIVTGTVTGIDSAVFTLPATI
jgi:hypothetical protein